MEKKWLGEKSGNIRNNIFKKIHILKKYIYYAIFIYIKLNLFFLINYILYKYYKLEITKL